MLNTTVLNVCYNITGTFRRKRRNRSVIYRRLPACNDQDDYHDVDYVEKQYEVLEMPDNSNNGRNNHHGISLYIKIVGIIAVIVMIVLGVLRGMLIPHEIQSYNPVNGRRLIGSLALQHQGIINSDFLAHFTYLNANRESQNVGGKLRINAQQEVIVLLEVAYIALPGFGIPGDLSGIKSVGIDIQQSNTMSDPNDPPVMSNNTVPLNGGNDRFFNFNQTTSLPTVTTKLSILVIGPVHGFALHCYNIYATTYPTFALFAEPAPGSCLSPFTESLP